MLLQLSTTSRNRSDRLVSSWTSVGTPNSPQMSGEGLTEMCRLFLRISDLFPLNGHPELSH